MISARLVIKSEDEALACNVGSSVAELAGLCVIRWQPGFVAEAGDILLWDHRGAEDTAQQSFAPAVTPRTMVVLDPGQAAAPAWLQQHPQLNHVLVQAAELEKWQIVPTIRKYLQQYAFGIQQYLDVGSTIHRANIVRYSDKAAVLQALRHHLRGAPACDDLSYFACSLASEMMMNAVFSAPIDRQTQQRRYAGLPRHHDIALEPHEQPVVTFGMDKSLLAISVSDDFGSLDKETVLAAWLRNGRVAREEGRHGAGVGLFAMLHQAHQMDFHISPGRHTEVVALLRVRPRFRDYQAGGCSVNFFITGQAGGINE